MALFDVPELRGHKGVVERPKVTSFHTPPEPLPQAWLSSARQLALAQVLGWRHLLRI